MRRRDVPCSPCGSGSSSGCGCCSLKEKLAVLWDRTIGSILKINNVTPDGDGKFEIKAGSNVTISEISNGIEISATGGSAEDVVKSVNGTLPDQDGDVTVDTGVLTVNGVSPDADGEVTITAGSNITITPDAGTNSIEIKASVPTVDAIAPIYIDGDGKIALEDWQLVTSTDWSVYKDSDNCATEDMLLFMCGDNGHDDVFIPKGVKLATIGMNIVLGKTGSTGAFVTSIESVYAFFNSNNYVTAWQSRTGINDSLSNANTINERFIVYGARNSVTINKLTDTTSTSGIRLYVRRH